MVPAILYKRLVPEKIGDERDLDVLVDWQVELLPNPPEREDTVYGIELV